MEYVPAGSWTTRMFEGEPRPDAAVIAELIAAAVISPLVSVVSSVPAGIPPGTPGIHFSPLLKVGRAAIHGATSPSAPVKATLTVAEPLTAGAATLVAIT